MNSKNYPLDLNKYFDDPSRRRFLRDFLSLTGWVFLTGAELTRSDRVAIAGDSKNADQNFGSLKGRIVFDGTPPKAEVVDLEKAGLSATDLEWFKSAGPVVNQDWVVDPKSLAVQWVYVWLQPLQKGEKWQVHDSLKIISPERKFITLEQEPTGYVPHCAAIQEGQGIIMKNSGPIAHVFNFNGFENDSFNKAMPPKSEIKVDTIKVEKTAVSINCPPHPWERMFLRIFDHPYFAVSKPDGTFEFNLVPKGPCRLVVWHERLGFHGGRQGRDGAEVTIEGGAITDVGDIRIKPTKS
jgi:hypothetical protein